MQIENRLNIEGSRHLTVEHHRVTDFFGLHWHSFFEIEIIKTGKGKTVVNGIEYDTDEYNLFFITPVDFHNFAATDTIELINISFDRDAISDSEVSALFYARTEKGYKLTPDEMRRLIYTAELLEYECEINGDSQKQILEYLLKLIFRKNGCVNMIDDRSRYSHAIREALLYIEQHFRENITLSDVAKHVGYAPAYFSRLFKDMTGQSYVEALTSLRLSSASALLSNGYSVADACFSSGFGSLSSFFDVFKKKFGVSPSRYK